MSRTDRLQAVIEEGLAGGWRGHFWPSLESTQDVARGAPARSVFVADFQSAGRGRHGRVWRAPPGTSLLLSFVLDMAGPPSLWRSTALAAVALVDAIEDVAPIVHPSIKWPNDVLLDGRKVAGILAESTWDGTRARVIVGVGVNVTTRASDFEGVPGATSVLLESGQSVDRGELLRALLRHLDAWGERPEAELQATWQARLWGRGQRVRLAEPDGEQDVVVLGAEPDGSLRVRMPDGTERTTATGELML